MAEQPIIIKRIKKSGHAGHHGGAWKVAYADFVTAMMAFFLLLWLLNAVTEEQLQGIADYFAPSAVSLSSGGAGGMLGGTAVGKGAMSSTASTPSFTLSLPPPTLGEGGDEKTDPAEGASQEDKDGRSNQDQKDAAQQQKEQQQKEQPEDRAKPMTEEQILKANAEREQKQFERAQEMLKQAINSIPELRKMADSLMVDNTPEGLRIQIVDQDGLTMFPLGSSEMFGHTRALIDLVSRVIKQLPEKIAISGHTDSTPFSGKGSYGNWELSTDRALATRRALLLSGVPADRIERVVGRSDTDPLMPNDPTNARNRRISIVLLRQIPPPSTVEVTPEAARSGEIPDSLKGPAQPLPPPPKPH